MNVIDPIIYQVEGSGLVSIKYDGTTEALIIANKVIGLNVAGPHQNFENSYYVKVSTDNNVVSDILHSMQFDFFSKWNWYFFREHSPIIAELLKNFESGEYYLETKEFDYRNVNFTTADIKYNFVSGGWNSEAFLLSTKNADELDRDKVSYYRHRIEIGEKPLIFALRKDYGSEVLSEFVIDGHHKLKAYIELGISPIVCVIINISGIGAVNIYEEIDRNVIDLMKEYKEIRETSYTYFY